MIYGYPTEGMMFCKDIVIPEITPEIKTKKEAGILHCGKANMERLLGCAFIEGYYTALMFPPRSESSMRRQAQRMNYEYCVQTMAGLMKKYAPEILK